MEATTKIQTDQTELAATLNKCVEAALDGQKSYGAASADVRPPPLKEVFRAYEIQRAGFVADLQREIDALGARHENEGSARGALHRAFASARLIVDGHNEETILTECMHGDANVLRVYEAALVTPVDFLPRTRAMLMAQRNAVKAALDDMKRRLAFVAERYTPVEPGPNNAGA